MINGHLLTYVPEVITYSFIELLTGSGRQQGDGLN